MPGASVVDREQRLGAGTRRLADLGDLHARRVSADQLDLRAAARVDLDVVDGRGRASRRSCSSRSPSGTRGSGRPAPVRAPAEATMLGVSGVAARIALVQTELDPLCLVLRFHDCTSGEVVEADRVRRAVRAWAPAAAVVVQLFFVAVRGGARVLNGADRARVVPNTVKVWFPPRGRDRRHCPWSPAPTYRQVAGLAPSSAQVKSTGRLESAQVRVARRDGPGRAAS